MKVQCFHRAKCNIIMLPVLKRPNEIALMWIECSSECCVEDFGLWLPKVPPSRLDEWGVASPFHGVMSSGGSSVGLAGRLRLFFDV